jgi:hypothetical protein
LPGTKRASLEEARLSDEAEAREEKDPLPKGTIWQYIVADVRQPAKKNAIFCPNKGTTSVSTTDRTNLVL